MQNEIFSTIFYGVLIFPSFYLLGSFIRPFLRFPDIKMEGIIYFALGLGAFAYYTVAIGHLKLLDRPAILVFLALIYALRWRSLNKFRRWLYELWAFLTQEKRVSYQLFVAAFLLTAGLTFLVCFVPETANDSLCYQLNLPKIFAKYHSTRPLFYDFNSYMPMLMQHLYAVALVLGSPALAKLFHWITGILLFFAVFLVIFQTTQRKLLALFCALVLWLTPTCINEVASTYVDVAASFFLFIGMWLFGEGLQSRKTAPFFFGGVFLGLVVSIKMIALLWAAAFMFLFCGAVLMYFRRSKLLRMILFGVFGATLGCGFWFVRNWIMEHNPVFPYMESLFGGPSLGLVGSYGEMGLPKTLTNFLLLPWNVTFRPNFFDRGFWIGPFFFLAIPFALRGAWKRTEARFCLVFVFLSVVLWFFISQNVRFLFPVFPVYMVAVAMGYDVLQGRGGGGSRWLKGVAGGLVVFLLLLAVYHYRYALQVVSGRWSSGQYLEKMERSYPIAEWVDQNLPEDALILNAEEVRQFYFRRDMARDIWFRSRTRYDKTVGATHLLAYLKEKGFTHVLRVYPAGRAGDGNEGSHFEILDRALSDPTRARSLVMIESKNIREDRYSYRIFEIAGER
ncbi:MAG: hypothetical protein ABH891_01170 [Candidatus Omnitrophota bacterium]